MKYPRLSTYVLRIQKIDVSYRDEDGEWMDGDYRELHDHGSVEIAPDRYDLSDYSLEEGRQKRIIAWAVDYLRTKTDVTEAPGGLYSVASHEWLSGSYEDPYTNKVTETSVWLIGAWTPWERAKVFRRVVAKR